MIDGKIHPMDERGRSSWGPKSECGVRNRSIDVEEARDRTLVEISEERGVSVDEVARNAVDASLKRRVRTKQR